MPDAVTNKTIFDTQHRVKTHLTNISDGTGESEIVKLDKSGLVVAFDGEEKANS